MTVAQLQPIIEPPADGASLSPAGSTDAKGVLLARVLDVLDREGVPYCIMHGYGTLPDEVNGDVDMLVPHEALPKRIAELLRNQQAQLGARVVQWFVDRAQLIVLSTTGADGQPVMLQLHISTDYDIANRLIYDGNQVLRTRRRHERGFWIPGGH